MAEACRDRRGALAAEALGNLEGHERTALLAHLDGCADCRRELDDLQRVARLLPLADVERLPDVPTPPDDLGERVLAAVRAVRLAVRRRRIRRGVAGAAVAAAAAAAVVFAIGVTDPGDDGTVGEELALGGEQASGRVALVERGWGTEVHLDARGLDPDEVYWLWLTGDDGGEHRVAAGTFRGGDDIEVVLAAALSTDDTRRVWVTDAADEVVLDAWRR